MSLMKHLDTTILKPKSQPHKFLSIKRGLYFLKPSAAERAWFPPAGGRARRGHKRVSALERTSGLKKVYSELY